METTLVNRVLRQYDINSKNVDYADVIKKAGKNPGGFVTSAEVDNSVVDTPHEAALLLSLSKKQWVDTILLLNELSRTYPERADYYTKQLNKVYEVSGVSKKAIEDAYIAQLKEYCANNDYFTFYIPGTKQLSPEVSSILKYLTAAPSERAKYKQDIIKITQNITKMSIRNGTGSPAQKTYDEFNLLITNYKDIESFVLPEIDRVYAQN